MLVTVFPGKEGKQHRNQRDNINVKSKFFDVLINGFSICGKGEEVRLGHMTATHDDCC
jgi:hypothetical protein